MIDESPSWFSRLRNFLQLEPKNQEELLSLLRDTEERSLIDGDTLRMIEGVIQFAKLNVRDIMVPKNQMVSIDQDADYETVLNIVRESGHSRFPVMNSGGDKILGIFHAKDLFRFDAQSKIDEFDVEDVARKASVVPESKRLDLLLSEFRSNRNHMAIVVDEYGVACGFVTIEDIIEQIVGEIEDEFDIDEEDFIKSHGNHEYVLKGHTPIEEFNHKLQANFSDKQYDTIGGIVMGHLGHLPQRGEQVCIEGWDFKVLNADSRRVKLLSCIDNRSQEKKA